MKTYLTSGFAAALIASATFAGAAMAQSTQYDPYSNSPPELDNQSVDTMSTGSIYADDTWVDRGSMANTSVDNSQDRGDYYQGAMRPIN